jgi:hypothetical protein
MWPLAPTTNQRISVRSCPARSARSRHPLLAGRGPKARAESITALYELGDHASPRDEALGLWGAITARIRTGNGGGRPAVVASGIVERIATADAAA